MPVEQAGAQVETSAGGELATEYMGLRLPSPLVASAGPLSQSLDSMKELEESGVGAIVMFSLFEEQVREENGSPDARPVPRGDELGATDAYLRLLEAGARTLSIPLIASLNGFRGGEWTATARRMQDAGAAAIEVNVYAVPGDLSMSGAEVEQRHLEILQSVKDVVSVPVAVKLSPYFSSLGQMALRLDEAGADALVLFNRFLQPDIDIRRREVVAGAGLSGQDEGLLSRTWLAALHGRVRASLAAASGVAGPDDVVKALLAGADVVMTTSALVRHGASYATELVNGLRHYLIRNQLTLSQLRGMLAVPADARVDEYERSGYLAVLEQARRRHGL
ncbi:dihydroorotate dehydrogenase-like protein [Propionibacterium australiense]|nr:dihydroorotate dehydrogenase-like protein [Propionibacterium australiense]